MVIHMSYQEVVAYWQEDALRDFKVAEGLGSLGHYAYALFFCHLALEKMLKAVYVSRNKKHAPFTHKLVLLAEGSNLNVTEKQKTVLDTITDFNLHTRYADWKKEFYAKYDKKEYADKYLQTTKELLSWLHEHLTQS